MGRTYEYVPAGESARVRDVVNRINMKMGDIIRSGHPELNFRTKLIWAGEMPLITRDTARRGGFDLEFDIFINAPAQGSKWDPGFVMDSFREAASIACKKVHRSGVAESSYPLTIRVPMDDDGKAVCFCDYSIIYFRDGWDYWYLRYDAKTSRWSFVQRELKYALREMTDMIYAAASNARADGSQWIADEYLRVKNSGRPGREAHLVYGDALQNIVARIRKDDA